MKTKIINFLTSLFATQSVLRPKLQSAPGKLDFIEISFRNKYEQRKISNRLFK